MPLHLVEYYLILAQVVQVTLGQLVIQVTLGQLALQVTLGQLALQVVIQVVQPRLQY
jgi:hypothetical protein